MNHAMSERIDYQCVLILLAATLQGFLQKFYENLFLQKSHEMICEIIVSKTVCGVFGVVVCPPSHPGAAPKRRLTEWTIIKCCFWFSLIVIKYR